MSRGLLIMTKPSGKAQGEGRPRMSLREQQRAVTHDRIITALSELIESRHPLDVTMAGVAEQAGVSEPTLYRHFPTKRDLFAALGSNLYRKTTAGVAPSNLDELVEFLPALYRQFAEMGTAKIRTFGKPESVLFDVKYILPADQVDARL